MPITIDCARCGRRFSLADEMAGQQAQCPCGNLLLVTPPAPNGQPAPLWRVWTPDGKVHGPVSKELLDQAVAAGRLNAAAHIICEGWTGWRPIASEYPQLSPMAGYAPTSAAAVAAAEHLPPGDFCQRCRSPKSPWALHCPACGFEDPHVKAQKGKRFMDAFWRTYDDFWENH
jgi:hypothetical protein